MPITAGHQHRVPGGEGAGLTVAHTGLCHMGPLAGALRVTSHCHIEGWKETGKQRCSSAKATTTWIQWPCLASLLPPIL